MNTSLSVIMTVLNEEAHIERCLNSLTWAHEIICIDTGSTDKTFELAQKFKNVKLYKRQWKGYSETKQEALLLASSPWVLWIDGDEEVPLLLKEAIQNAINTHEPKMAFAFPRKNFVLGQWIRFGGWYPDCVLRLFPRALSSFGHQALHEKVILDPSVQTKKLLTPLLHYTYTSWGQYYKKMIRYAYLSGLDIKSKRKSFILFKLFAYPPFAFFRAYILKCGFLDGRLGLLLSLGSGMGALMRYSYAYLFQFHKEPPP